jgi:biopolymer transport protein ExbD
MKTRSSSLIVVLTILAASWPPSSLCAEPQPGTAQALQKGISVELPVTRAARPMPDADKEDAWIVAVTADGSAYLGINPISPAALAEEAKRNLSRHTEKKLYIKVDARTSYANVVKVLDAVRNAGVETVILLTSQRVSPDPGTRVPPYGLEMLLSSALHSGSEAAVVEVLESAQRRPALKVNAHHVAWATLQSTLAQLFQNEREKVVRVKADRTLPFADVVAVADTSCSTGARVVLVTPGL